MLFVTVAYEICEKNGRLFDFAHSVQLPFGVLQFDVLKFRLESEYNVDIILESLPYEYIRWVDNDDIDMTTAKGATAAIGKITTALAYVNEARSKIGAYQNRVEMTLSYLELLDRCIAAELDYFHTVQQRLRYRCCSISRTDKQNI